MQVIVGDNTLISTKLIRFEGTGSGSAINIYIKDIIAVSCNIFCYEPTALIQFVHFSASYGSTPKFDMFSNDCPDPNDYYNGDKINIKRTTTAGTSPSYLMMYFYLGGLKINNMQITVQNFTSNGKYEGFIKLE